MGNCCHGREMEELLEISSEPPSMDLYKVANEPRTRTKRKTKGKVMSGNLDLILRPKRAPSQSTPDDSLIMLEGGGKGKNIKLNNEGGGEGTFKFRDGSTYTGQFLDNNIHGKGIYLWNNGRTYDGHWVKGKMHGNGIFSWPEGRLYNGHYFEDKKHGKGTLIWPDGKKYTGNWVNGLQDGEGVFLTLKGNSKRGLWKNGKLLKWLVDL